MGANIGPLISDAEDLRKNPVRVRGGMKTSATIDPASAPSPLIMPLSISILSGTASDPISEGFEDKDKPDEYKKPNGHEEPYHQRPR